MKEDALPLCGGFEVVEQRAQQLFFGAVTRIAPDMEVDQPIQCSGGFNVPGVAARDGGRGQYWREGAIARRYLTPVSSVSLIRSG